jgi:hypothetical protein
MENHLNNFRQWVQEQKPILNSLDTDEFLLRFLRVTDFNLDQAKEWLIHFCKYRTENPQWFPFFYINFIPKFFLISFRFTNRDLIKNPIMHAISETAYCLQTPKETKDNEQIFLMRIGHFDTTKYILDDVTKYAFAVTDILNTLPAAQINGYIILLDFSDIKLQHVGQFTPDHAKRYVDCWEKMYPVQLRQIHYYNYPSLFDPVLHLFKRFYYRKLNDKIFLHPKTSDGSANKSLHQYIDPSLLPSEYGGQLGSIEGEMNQAFVQWTREHNDCMIQLDQYGVDLKQISKLLKTVKKENNQ